MRRCRRVREFARQCEDKISDGGDASQNFGGKNHSTGVPLVTPVVENRFRGFVSWPLDCIMLLGPGVLLGLREGGASELGGKGLYVRTLYGESTARHLFRAL